jgi:ABC-type multidrug transport system ATPase subunit
LEIALDNIGKRYNAHWIFRGVQLQLKAGHAYAVLGANGSGKSTLLQVIAGNLIPSEGKLSYSSGSAIPGESVYSYVSLAAPYLELIEEFTLLEVLNFHMRFKKMRGEMNRASIVERCYLGDAAYKKIKDYSSGMKQRVKLALAILSDTPVLLLDEPCSNLDAKAVQWYKTLVEEHKSGRIVVVCSNEQKDEYSFCNSTVRVEDYKR